jgi:hypothetical protein
MKRRTPPPNRTCPCRQELDIDDRTDPMCPSPSRSQSREDGQFLTAGRWPFSSYYGRMEHPGAGEAALAEWREAHRLCATTTCRTPRSQSQCSCSRRAALSPGHHHDCRSNDALCDCFPRVMHALTDLQTSHRTCADPRCVPGSTFSPAPSSIRPATAGNAYRPPHAGDDSSSDCRL